MDRTKTNSFKIVLLAILSIVVFATAAFLIRAFLIPLLPDPWQIELTWIAASILATVAILSGLAQFTGLSLRYLLSPRESAYQASQKEITQGAVIVSESTGGKIEWTGDIIQDGSTKIVLSRAEALDTRPTTKPARADSLISDIQSTLYEDSSRLPYVLALCLDLCEPSGLSEEYDMWLRKELNGYDDYQGFQRSFESENNFEEWMNKWADHRFVKSYLKMEYYSSERNRYEISTLPHTGIFVAFPVAQIARAIQGARERGDHEFSVLLLSLGQEHFDELQAFVDKLSPKVILPADLQVFYSVSGLEKVLDGVRNIVLSLLRDVRRKTSYI